MSAEANFKASYAGIGAMLRSKWMMGEMVRRADMVKTYAEQAAPVGEGSGAGGYKDSFKVVPVERGGSKHNRAAALVVNDDPAAVHVEYGTIAQPGDHTMLKALDVLRGES